MSKKTKTNGRRHKEQIRARKERLRVYHNKWIKEMINNG